MPRLHVDQLHKRFGAVHALRGATFRVEVGEVRGADGRTIAEGTLDAVRVQAGLPNGGLEDVFLALA